MLQVETTVISFFIMTAVSLETLSFVPAQVRGANNRSNPRNKPSTLPQHSSSSTLLIPSQVVQRRGESEIESNRIDSIDNIDQSSQQRLLDEPNTSSSDEELSSAPRRQNKKKKRPRKHDRKRSNRATNDFPLSGNLPDISWRAISMDHLRQHPRFRPLPPLVTHLTCLEDVRNFRQDSWQWDTLHRGRCTTSQAVAALGFLEPDVGELLGIPRSWRKGARGAYLRLCQTPLRRLQDMERALLQDTEGQVDSNEIHFPDERVWTTVSPEADGRNRTFVATYNYTTPQSELKRRREYSQKVCRQGDSMSVRMLWGTTQEATALLTALNYLGKSDPGLYLEEVGMCGAGLELNQTQSQSSLLVGASPDGVLRYSDGRMEVLEVKNHSPFLVNRIPRKRHTVRKRSNKQFFVGDRDFVEREGDCGGIFPHYFPQLQLEMLSVGPECKSAVMVRQTATKGALILRMERDDRWIHEMLHFLHKFQSSFVEKQEPPHTNFFWHNTSDRAEQARYRRFVNHTQALKNQVKVVGVVPHDEIQRVPDGSPLFLD